MADAQGSNIVRIVNISELLTEPTLKNLVQTLIQPKGNIEKVFIRKDNDLNIVYAYLVFEYSYDALKTSQNLNGYIFNTHKFEVELIGPVLEYKKYRPSIFGVPESSLMRRQSPILGNKSYLSESLLLKRRQGQSMLMNRLRYPKLMQQAISGTKNNAESVKSTIPSINRSANNIVTAHRRLNAHSIMDLQTHNRL